MTTTRQVALAALVQLVNGAFAWVTPTATKLRHFADCDKSTLPRAFVCQNGPETYSYSGTMQIRTIEVRLFIYSDGAIVNGSDLQNQILEALDAALMPQGAEQAIGRNTLGGVVHQCRLEGSIEREPGDLDGYAVIVAPIKIIIP